MMAPEQSPDSERIRQMIRSALIRLFRLDPARITPEARLADDLEIDSIDAVDMVEEIKRATGRKVGAEELRSVRTIDDLVQAVERLIRS